MVVTARIAVPRVRQRRQTIRQTHRSECEFAVRESVTDRLSAQKLSSTTERTNAEDLDMTQAISDFSNQQTGYDAALKAYSMVQRLSLFNYLNS